MALAAVIALARNIERGSRLDRESGDLVWWQNRTRRSAGQGGRIALARIAEIRIDRSSDSDRLRLIDVAGRPVPGFDEEAVPLPHRGWAEALVQHAPHVRIVEVS